jgi:hypothetical protein
LRLLVVSWLVFLVEGGLGTIAEGVSIAANDEASDEGEEIYHAFSFSSHHVAHASMSASPSSDSSAIASKTCASVTSSRASPISSKSFMRVLYQVRGEMST